MKKILIALLCVITLGGCMPAKSGLIHVSAEDAITSIENKATMVLFVGKSNCGACTEFKKVVDEIVANHDLRIDEVYIDDETAVDNEYPNFKKLEEHIGIVGGTPSVFFIKEGVVTASFTGSSSYNTFLERLKKHGFISE